MKTALASASIFAISAAAPAAAQSVQDFQLPPAPSPTPTQTPQVQGPVDSDAPVTTTPRVIPTGTPSPTPQQPVRPTPTPPPAASRPAAVRTPTASPTPSRVPAVPPRQTTQVPGPIPVQAPTPQAQTPILPPSADVPSSPATPSVSTASLPTFDEEQPIDGNPFAWWTWLLAALVGVAAFAGGLWFMRNRQYSPANVPTIEPPLARRQPPPASEPHADVPEAPNPSTAVPDGHPLVIDAAPVKLSRSMRFASLAYRVTLKNRGKAALSDIVIGSDITTAHGSLASDQQLADATRELPETGRIGSIKPGEEIELSGEVQLPLGEIRTIRQGNAYLYVPLLRVRAQANGGEATARTFIVGTLPNDQAQKLQPFRLDEMPQTYRNIGLAPLDR